ncbi:MAG TPA: hypothetical protein PK544_01900 [Spirochaetota bacterium]|nr:hypothetical protein [Spirochaetota bacterium]HPJ37022.1 hypothetical protein [Spirochaetota bacterium]HPQ53565.1 hypothetical protein [Spirochaetota bacterium]
MKREIIENLINQSLKRIHDEYELRNTTFLNALHHNIDYLTTHAEDWFGSDIPEGFKHVITSLTTLSYMYFQERADFSKTIIDPKYEEIDCCELISSITGDISSLLQTGSFRIGTICGPSIINTSRAILRDSLYNIFISISQFMDTASDCLVTIEEDQSSVRIKISFSGLKDNMPDISKLTKILFSYSEKGQYHINIGLSIAFDNLRNIGAIVKISDFVSEHAIEITISFPSTIFLQTVEEIRKGQEKTETDVEGKLVLLCIDDIIIEMVLRETLQERGFTTRKILLKNIEDHFEDSATVIIDYGCIQQSETETCASIAAKKDTVQFIIIHGGDYLPENLPERGNIVIIQKPFDVDMLVDKIL